MGPKRKIAISRKKIKSTNKVQKSQKQRDILERERKSSAGKSNFSSRANFSGYAIPEASKLVPGEGILSYSNGAKPAQAKKVEHRPEPALKKSIPSEPPKPRQNTESSSDSDSSAKGTTQIHDNFMSFDLDDDEADADLQTQFSQYEKEQEQEEENAKSYISARSATLPIPKYPHPWNKEVFKCDTMGEHLTQEIKNYVAFVSPTKLEIRTRDELVRRNQRAIQSTLRGCKVHLFGSSATGMYLPGADVDMVVELSPQTPTRNLKSLLYKLSNRMRDWAQNIQVISRARVPIVKYVDKETKLNVDISLGESGAKTGGMGGVTAIKTVLAWKKKYPALSPLVLVIKQFLRRRQFSEVYLGGLGGFAVICMVVSFLENHPLLQERKIDALENLGILLLEFFEFYGKTFNTQDMALRMTGSMNRIYKRHNSNLISNNPVLLAIEDPNDSANNITRASHQWVRIQREFGHASDLLKRLFFEYSNLPEEERYKRSFLGILLKNTDAGGGRHSLQDMRAKLQRLNGVPLKNDNNKAVSHVDEQSKDGKDDAKKTSKTKKKKKKSKESKKAAAAQKQDSPQAGDASESLKRRLDIVDLTDSPKSPNKRKLLGSVFEAASSSDSNPENPSDIPGKTEVIDVSSDTDEDKSPISRTKAAVNERRAYWNKKAQPLV